MSSTFAQLIVIFFKSNKTNSNEICRIEGLEEKRIIRTV